MKTIIRGRGGRREQILEETGPVEIPFPEKRSPNTLRQDWWKYLLALILVGAAGFLWAGPALTQSAQSAPQTQQEAAPGQ